MPMTPDAKRALSQTIRSLRSRLLDDLEAAAEGTYRLSLKAKDAKLDEAHRIQRARLEEWLDEQVHTLPKEKRRPARERFLLEVVKDAASTLLNRIVYLRLLEAAELREEKVVTGGWESRGYKDFREFAPELVRNDPTEGYARLLGLIFDELAIELPGLYGDVRLTSLIPVPAATLRALVEALDAPELESCWTDDMTLGWVYQYWNDPEREALDAKLNSGGKVEPHEIASKTQMFTERYMVDWLLQNSLGPMWLAMCKKHGWTPEVEADGTLDRLEERRVAWRAKRDAGEVSLTELMPLESDAERRWAYYVPQPIPEVTVAQANESVRDLKILDPAVGSGHFLVVAFDLLAALYREEARHRGEEGESPWSEQAIVERILEHNLHGIDLDPRAVQIAAAALWLKAQQTCTGAQPQQLNLVASNLRLSGMPEDDPGIRELKQELERETGIPAKFTQRLLDALAGADHLGSLLKIDAAVDEAIAECEELLPEQKQGELFDDDWKDRRVSIDKEEAKSTLLERLEAFLHAHSHGDDLGLKLKGEQLTAGVRFVRLLREGTFDLVVANPPYQGTSKMVDTKYVVKRYPLGKADLFAAFLLRGLQLVRDGGVSAMLTLRNWMFTHDYRKLRPSLLKKHHLRSVGDFDRGAFEDVPDEVVSVAVSVFVMGAATRRSVASLPTPRDDRSRDSERTHRKRAATLCQVGRYEFDSATLKVVPEWPLVYWWDDNLLEKYASHKKLGEVAPVRQGLATSNNSRFLRQPWELLSTVGWESFIKGGEGRRWIEPVSDLITWRTHGLEVKVMAEVLYKSFTRTIKNETFYKRPGIAFTMIGHRFDARAHRVPSIIDVVGSSAFVDDIPTALCALNMTLSRQILSALNPTIHFQVGDVNRLPLFTVDSAQDIWHVLNAAMSIHEEHREPSVEFRSPGPSPWRHAQDWAQQAVDRPEGEALRPYIEELDQEPPTDDMSFALGVALGRFGANGKGILDPESGDLAATLPFGICFLDGTLEENVLSDSLGHGAFELLHEKRTEHGGTIDNDLRTWLRLKFFGDVHKGMYENRPIYFPLSSSKKTFVAYVSIHRWDESTLRNLLAEHLHPTLTRFEGEIADLREARQSADKKANREAEQRYALVDQWKRELEDFIEKVEQCAEQGPPPPDAKTPEREVDTRYDPDLDDGVMINSAALWPLLEPQWKEPKKWWKELATAKGKKDYDWSHLAARYFPSRVDEKCKEDPSLGVAHGCFWKYHPETAYKWELRLQDEIGPDFTLDEEGSDELRSAFEAAHPEKVAELQAAEEKRRERKKAKESKKKNNVGPLFEADRAAEA